MELLLISADNPETGLISRAAKSLREGRIIIYPTDTVYGIGCSVFSEPSVRRIFDLKGRGTHKPLSLAFPDLETAKRFAVIGPQEEDLILKSLKEPMTYVVRKRPAVPDYVTADRDTVGIRIPDNKVLKALLYAADMPIITSSANISGHKAPRSIEEVSEGLLEKVDFVIDSGPCRTGIPSKVIDVRTGNILRKS